MSRRDDTVPLDAFTVTDALVLPTFRLPDSPNTLFMGVMDSSGAVLEDSLLDRRSGERGDAVPKELRPTRAGTALERGIYCGPLYYHYGHFLLESLARLWYAAREPTVPLVWAGAKNWDADRELHSWQKDILDVLGVENPIVIVTSPVRVGALMMPDIGYRYDDWCHPEHAGFLAAYHGPGREESTKVWLSRSRVSKDVRDLNAPAVERRLEAAGWTIAYPEELRVREQLDVISRAAVVAGEEGSAFHSLLLLDDLTGKKFHVMRRLGSEHRNMHTVGDVRGVDQTFHTLSNEVVINASGRYVTKISANSAEVLDALDVPVAPDESDATDEGLAEVVTAIAERTAAVSYLEVGITKRSALPHTDVPRRTAVSAQLPFDPRAHETEGVRLFEVPLEGYLAHFDDPGYYDIVRVPAPQTDRDSHVILDALTLTHPRTVWLVELPEDEDGEGDPVERLHRLLPSLTLVEFAHGGVRAAVARRDPASWRAPRPGDDDSSAHFDRRMGARMNAEGLYAALDAIGPISADQAVNVERLNRDLRAERDEQAQRISDQKRELDRLRHEVDELRRTNANLGQGVSDLSRQVREMLNSRSWVITAPVRSASDALRRWRR